MIQGTKVFDFHCHFPVKGDFCPGYDMGGSSNRYKGKNSEQSEIWSKAWNFPGPKEEVHDDHEASDRWYQDVVEKEI